MFNEEEFIEEIEDLLDEPEDFAKRLAELKPEEAECLAKILRLGIPLMQGTF